MKPRRRHRWVRSVAEARAIQLRLAPRVRIEPFRLKRGVVAGLDVSYSRRSTTLWAGVVVVNLADGRIVEERTGASEAPFPYVPTYLSFRELPACLNVLERVRSRPECLLCDGQGLAHPRLFGLATHLGYLLDRPTVGCAKSRLVGDYDEPPDKVGAWTPLALDGRTVGAVLRTRRSVKPVFVSPGHRTDVASAVEVVLAACSRYRLPEPTRLAHQAVNRARLEAAGIT